MRKHVDLIAVAVLLIAIGVFTKARHLVVVTMSGPVHYLRLENGRRVKMPSVPDVPPMPRIPKIPLQRD